LLRLKRSRSLFATKKNGNQTRAGLLAEGKPPAGDPALIAFDGS
jgi:hypothetical protein